MVVKRQASGTLFSVADSESVAQSRQSKAQRKLNNSDFLRSAAASRESDSPSVRQVKAQPRVRQFDQLQAPIRSPPWTQSKAQAADSFASGQSAAHTSEKGPRPFKNPATKGIKLYPGERHQAQ